MAKMTEFMRAAGNVEICMRRKALGVYLCDPLADNNIFALLPPKNQSSADEKANIFMLATRVKFLYIYKN